LERTGLDKSNKNRSGVPDPKKFERTGKDTFVVHADGGNYFEGKVENPNVKLKDSGKIFVQLEGTPKDEHQCYDCVNNHFRNEAEYEKYRKGLDTICDGCRTHEGLKTKFKAKVKNAGTKVL
jgi:hypothetical protein